MCRYKKNLQVKNSVQIFKNAKDTEEKNNETSNLSTEIWHNFGHYSAVVWGFSRGL